MNIPMIMLCFMNFGKHEIPSYLARRVGIFASKYNSTNATELVQVNVELCLKVKLYKLNIIVVKKTSLGRNPSKRFFISTCFRSIH